MYSNSVHSDSLLNQFNNRPAELNISRRLGVKVPALNRQKPVCLFCRAYVALMQDYKIRRHYETKQHDKRGMLDRLEIRGGRVEEVQQQ